MTFKNSDIDDMALAWRELVIWGRALVAGLVLGCVLGFALHGYDGVPLGKTVASCALAAVACKVVLRLRRNERA